MSHGLRSGSCRRLIILSFGIVLLGSFFSTYKGTDTKVEDDGNTFSLSIPQVKTSTQALDSSTFRADRTQHNSSLHDEIPTTYAKKLLHYEGVSSFSDSTSWCRSNPFLISWNPSKFKDAAASVVEYRSSIVSRTHEKTWNAHIPNKDGGVTHKPYNSLPSIVPCADEVYTDSDAKVVCGLSHLKDPCIIYSLGSDGNFAFEEAVAKNTPCEIHTFDCTVNKERLPSVFPPRVTYHSICLGSDEEFSSKYRSMGSLMREFGHTRVDLLKMDIEGFEFRVVEALYSTFLKEGGKNLPLQIAFEQHYLTGGASEPAWSNHNPGLSAGDMAILWIDLTDMGYILNGRKDNPDCPYCTELSAMRAFC